LLSTQSGNLWIHRRRPVLELTFRGEEKNSQPLPGLEYPIIQPVAYYCNVRITPPSHILKLHTAELLLLKYTALKLVSKKIYIPGTVYIPLEVPCAE